jgi:hypothetical protein
VLELLVGFGGGTGTEHVAGFAVAVPQAHALQPSLLHFQLDQGELVLANLFVDLSVELVAVGEELDPRGSRASQQCAGHQCAGHRGCVVCGFCLRGSGDHR